MLHPMSVAEFEKKCFQGVKPGKRHFWKYKINPTEI